MAKPARQHQAGTFFITTSCSDKHALFQVERNAQLFLDTLLHYREHYGLHEFVIMPDHLHLLITPHKLSLERVMQYIKGGFSHALSQQYGKRLAVWQRGFTDHRIRDRDDYEKHVAYLRLNPVKDHLSAAPGDYFWSSAAGQVALDPYPVR